MGSFGQSLLLASGEADIAEALAELIEGMGLRRCALVAYGRGGGVRLLLDKGPAAAPRRAFPAAIDLPGYFARAWRDEASFHSYSLRSGAERLGLLAYSCGDEELGAMSACGAFLSLGLKRVRQLEADAERARSLEELAEERGRELAREARRRRAVEAEVLRIGELERERIGLDLHDDLCQRLAGIAMLASCASAPPGRLERIRAIAEDALERARRYAHDAYPIDLEGIDLETALKRLCERLSEEHPGIRFSGSLGRERPSPRVKLNAYRIAQEALSNALRHAGASSVRLSLGLRAGGFRLTVEDDGAGGAARAAGRGAQGGRAGLGLRSMRYRADQIGAMLAIRSPRGAGTSITLDAPLKEEGEEGYGEEA
jgi:signal transduction histidine kinase